MPMGPRVQPERSPMDKACHPGPARGVKIRGRGVSARASGGPGSALGLSRMANRFAGKASAIAPRVTSETGFETATRHPQAAA